MGDIPPEITGELRDRIHAGLLRIDADRQSRSAPQPKLAKCLEAAYDVFAGELLGAERQLTEPVLAEISTWVFRWAWGRWLFTMRPISGWPGYFTMGDSSKVWQRDDHLVIEADGTPPSSVLGQCRAFEPLSEAGLEAGVRKSLEGRIIHWQAEALTAAFQKRATPEADQRTDIAGQAADLIRDRAPRAAAKRARYPARAAWLRAQLTERKWNKHDLARYDGPDHKTTQKVLDGCAVQDGVLQKIAQGLSAIGAKVSLTEIPQK
jgi:hypothetical protein